jgi:uncharacterized membrane protein
MNKLDFIWELHERLSGLPSDEVDERISFYAEMIDDRIEDGLGEEEAVADIGPIDRIVDQIIADVPFAKIAKEKIKPKRKMRAWEIVLLAVGSPLWITLGAVALAVFLTLYAVLWTLVAVAWSVFAVFAACAPAGIAGGIIFCATGKSFSGVALIGAGILLAGLAIFAFFGCLAATKGCAVLTKKIALGIKKCFVRKEKLQ